MSSGVERKLLKARKLQKIGQNNQAEAIYKEILAKFPKNKRALDGYNQLRAGIAPNRSRLDEAPHEKLQQLSQMYNAGRQQEVINQSTRLIQLFPKSQTVLSFLGASYNALKMHDEAIGTYQKVLKINPNFPEMYYNIGLAQQAKGSGIDAIDSYKKAIFLKPDYVEAYTDLGNALRDHYKLEDAIISYKKAIEINPSYAQVYNNLGALLLEKGLFDEAVSYCEKALNINQNIFDAHFNIGTAKVEQEKKLDSIESFTSALKINPDYQMARCMRYHQQSHVCNWKDMAKEHSKVENLGLEEIHVEPWAMLALEDAPDKHFIRSKLFAKNNFKQSPLSFSPSQKSKGDRIRLGYFSADFHNHATMYLFAKVMECHDTQNFEVFAYSFGPDSKDEMRLRLVSSVDYFNDVKDMSDLDIALLAREHEIDIAIDLKGYTTNGKSGIFAFRAAPIQINFLGYPGTMGADFIDYIIADKVVIPSEQEHNYGEKIIFMPNSYLPNRNDRNISKKILKKSDLGLPENGFIFCCFNSNYKITAKEFDIWVRLLKANDNSVLWLLNSNKWARENLQNEVQERGLDPNKLVFADFISQDEHLARLKFADLFLDTFNVNAHTTAGDALWVGVPVITKSGKGFAARVAASLLTTLDLTELITKTEQEYEDLIMDLVRKPKLLSDIKVKLSKKRLTSPLFNSELFAKHLEESYQMVFKRYFNGKSPQTMVIPS